MLISQLQLDGYSIFVVTGQIPTSEADLFALNIPVPPAGAVQKCQEQPSNSTTKLLQAFSGKGYSLQGSAISDENQEFAKALAMSLSQDPQITQSLKMISAQDTEIQKAMQDSIKEYDKNSPALKAAMKASLNEDEMLNAAITASLLPVNSNISEESDKERMRLKRLEKFNK